MRVSAEAVVLDTEGALEAHRTTIASSRKMIRMNIDDTYSDKELAVVRELATNAADSHLRAQNPNAFYVHCPTVLKPEFFVRDYGVGMTHEKMVGTYIVLGESDKDTSDDEAGMWGIGALAPFSKCDQYYITCYDGTSARHYGFAIAEDGCPTLYLLGEEPCQEPRGVRVGFSAEEKDFGKFEAAIQKIALGFGSQLETNAALKGVGEVAFTGAGWTAYLNCPLYSRWNVRQGGVIYPIDQHKVKLPIDHKLTFVVDCPIGGVKITPSRESIAYTDAMVAYLAERVEQAVEGVRASVTEQVKGIKSAVEFFETLKKLKPSFLTGEFVHKPTGLTGPSILADAPQVFFSAVKDTNGRWTFSTLGELKLTDHIKHGTAFMIDDVTPYLDPSREEAVNKGRDWLTQSEVRRLSRLTRAYLDAAKREHGLFLFNTTYSTAFWKATLPGMKRVPLTFEEVRKAIPRRIAPPVNARPPIRGIALAKAAGEQRPVFEIAPRAKGENVAWVSSDQYRKAAGALFKLARRFDFAGLYIVAPGSVEVMAEHGVPPLREAINAVLAEKGTAFDQWYASRNTGHYQIKNLTDYLSRLLVVDAEAYDRFARTRGVLGGIARALRNVSAAHAIEMSEEERRACAVLLVDAAGKAIEIETPEDIKALAAAAKQFSDNYGHPVVKWFDHVAYLKTDDQIIRAGKAVIHIEKLFPLTERVRGY